MAWIESHQSLGTHKKLYHLATILEISRPQAIGHLHYLWWWALDNVPDGKLHGVPIEVIADVCQWKDDPQIFFNGLLAAGWVDSDHGLHDWNDYAGKLILRRKADRERHRKSLGIPMECQQISDGLPSLPYPTVNNRTQQNSIDEDTLNPPALKTSTASVELLGLDNEVTSDSEEQRTYLNQLEKAFIDNFQYCFGREPNTREKAQIRDFSQEISLMHPMPGIIVEAMKEAAKSGKNTISYVSAILRSWLGLPKKNAKFDKNKLQR
jgi:DnaD/phage-associated family protein